MHELSLLMLQWCKCNSYQGKIYYHTKDILFDLTHNESWNNI